MNKAYSISLFLDSGFAIRRVNLFFVVFQPKTTPADAFTTTLPAAHLQRHPSAVGVQTHVASKAGNYNKIVVIDNIKKQHHATSSSRRPWPTTTSQPATASTTSTSTSTADSLSTTATCYLNISSSSADRSLATHKRGTNPNNNCNAEQHTADRSASASR